MLRIKKEIDLKELEKFGWYEFRGQYCKGKFTIQKNRHIRSRAGNQWNGLDDLFDLIETGFVEKTED